MSARLAVAAITIDFGNTLVRTDRASFANVVDETADALSLRGLVTDRAAFLAAWAEERDRQFREEVPLFREVDVKQRAVRVLARLRGLDAPPERERWDDLAAAARVEPEEVDTVVDAYSAAFIDRMQPVDDAAATLARLAADGFALAILSNWPLAVTIDRYAEAQGWLPFLRAMWYRSASGPSSRIPPSSGRPRQSSGSGPAGGRQVLRPERPSACRSSTSATTGPLMWSVRRAPAGEPRTCAIARATRRCRHRSPVTAWPRTSTSKPTS